MDDPTTKVLRDANKSRNDSGTAHRNNPNLPDLTKEKRADGIKCYLDVLHRINGQNDVQCAKLEQLRDGHMPWLPFDFRSQIDSQMSVVSNGGVERHWLKDRIYDKLQVDQEGYKFVVVCGESGTGKSVLAAQLQRDVKCGSYHACTRNADSPLQVVKSLCAQLDRHSTTKLTDLAEQMRTLAKNRGDAQNLDACTYKELASILTNTVESLKAPPKLIIVDALNQSPRLLPLFEEIHKQLSLLPSAHVKMFCTTTHSILGKWDLEQACSPEGKTAENFIELKGFDNEVTKDIRQYLEQKQIQEKAVKQILARVGLKFQFASLHVNHLLSGKDLETMPADIHAFYETYFERTFTTAPPQDAVQGDGINFLQPAAFQIADQIADHVIEPLLDYFRCQIQHLHNQGNNSTDSQIKCNKHEAIAILEV